MLEHLLDTRLNVQVGPNDDPFLDDFLLTHIVFMPIAQLVVSCNRLKLDRRFHLTAMRLIK